MTDAPKRGGRQAKPRSLTLDEARQAASLGDQLERANDALAKLASVPDGQPVGIVWQADGVAAADLRLGHDVVVFAVRQEVIRITERLSALGVSVGPPAEQKVML